MSGKDRKEIRPGLKVGSVVKQDQRSGEVTRGAVKDVVTNLSHQPHGIKVGLEAGEVGRVEEILQES